MFAEEIGFMSHGNLLYIALRLLLTTGNTRIDFMNEYASVSGLRVRCCCFLYRTRTAYRVTMARRTCATGPGGSWRPRRRSTSWTTSLRTRRSASYADRSRWRSRASTTWTRRACTRSSWRRTSATTSSTRTCASPSPTSSPSATSSSTPRTR